MVERVMQLSCLVKLCCDRISVFLDFVAGKVFRAFRAAYQLLAVYVVLQLCLDVVCKAR